MSADSLDWVCPPLPLEIYDTIIRFARRPLTNPGRPAQWKELHQSSLARCMRVNKMFHDLAAPILYDTVVFNDLPTFAYGLADDRGEGAEYNRVSKLECLSYINRIFVEDPNVGVVRSIVGVSFASSALQYLDEAGRPPPKQRDGSVSARLLVEWRYAAVLLARVWADCRPATGALSRPLRSVSFNCWLGRHNTHKEPHTWDYDYVGAVQQLACTLNPEHVCMHSEGVFAWAEAHAWPVVVDKCGTAAIEGPAAAPASDSAEPSTTTPLIAPIPDARVTVHVSTTNFCRMLPYWSLHRRVRPFPDPVSNSATTVCYDLAHVGPKMFCSQGPAWQDIPRNELRPIVRDSFTQTDKHTRVHVILPIIRDAANHGSLDQRYDWGAGWRDAWMRWFDIGMQHCHAIRADKRVKVERAQDARPCMACGVSRGKEEAVARRSIIPLELGEGIYDFVRSYNWIWD